MADRKSFLDEDVEIALAEDAIDRIEEFWFDQLNISHDDYIYIKRVNKHIILGKAKIELIE